MSIETMVPTRDNVLIRKAEHEDFIVKNGLYISTFKSRFKRGVVVKSGIGTRVYPKAFSAGDIVYYQASVIEENGFKENNNSYAILKQAHFKYVLNNDGSITPTNNFILIRKIKKKIITQGGIIIPDNIKRSIGEVVSKGHMVNTINKGDIVIYDKSQDENPIEVHGENLYIMPLDYIFGKY